MYTDSNNLDVLCICFEIEGLIQGVGFRPYVYRLASSLGLSGMVLNHNKGVSIHVQGKSNRIDVFEHRLQKEAPKASIIKSVRRVGTIEKTVYTSFSIQASECNDSYITLVSPDIAVCEDCLKDIKSQDHRINYPLTNCTNCGPRFSIIKSIPYDRPATSMDIFEMCACCSNEYHTITDRRFHAQPISCLNCGPTYTLYETGKTIQSFERILPRAAQLIEEGKTLAILGMGGFNLACDAFNAKAVQTLRKVKQRDGKPFALLFRDIDTVKKHVELSQNAEQLLLSWQRPIVLADLLSPGTFPIEISNNLKTMGIILPYLPLHYLLFDKLSTNALVLTSGNLSNCPIIIDNDEALSTFSGKVDGILSHNRKIINRVDDSVAQIINGKPQLIRRARGYAPLPIKVDKSVEGILACGAELSNAFAIGKQDQVIVSQHIGDLKNLETMKFFESSLNRLSQLFKFTPTAVACDLHPDYLSTRFANKMGLPLVNVQHHHAHIASVMAEYGLKDKVIGISFDGTGYGTDGNIWGSEIFICDYKGFERRYHFEYVPIPGGDKVASEPWRSALAYLNHAFAKRGFDKEKLFSGIDQQKCKLAQKAIELNINAPLSCSAGRLFDAISSILGLCQHANYNAEAPILLEHACASNIDKKYDIILTEQISWKGVVRQIVTDIENMLPKEIIAAKFHNTVVQVCGMAIHELSTQCGINQVVISGGTFQNRYLTKKLVDLVNKYNLEIYLPEKFPCNDGGIALGQLMVAQCNMHKG